MGNKKEHKIENEFVRCLIYRTKMYKSKPSS